MDLSRLFLDDEVSREVEPQWSEQELLAQNGLFPLAKVAAHLHMDGRRLREFAREQEASGIDVYQQYGLKKMRGSQWKVLMRVFRNHHESFKQRFGRSLDRAGVQTLDEQLSREHFFNLRGFFKLKEVMEQGFLPLGHREVTSYLKTLENPREQAAAWREGKDWFVDFEPFILNLNQHFHGE